MDKETYMKKLDMFTKQQKVKYMWSTDYAPLYDKLLVKDVNGYLVLSDVSEKAGTYVIVPTIADTISDLDVKTFFNDFESEEYDRVINELQKENK